MHELRTEKAVFSPAWIRGKNALLGKISRDHLTNFPWTGMISTMVTGRSTYISHMHKVFRRYLYK
jgi:hypothetical protein